MATLQTCFIYGITTCVSSVSNFILDSLETASFVTEIMGQNEGQSMRIQDRILDNTNKKCGSTINETGLTCI